MKDNEGDLRFNVTTRKHPKKNPVQYEFQTIEEIFDSLTVENYKRFLRDFRKGIEISVHMREVVIHLSNEQLKAEQKETIDNTALKMKTFTWIDD